MRPEIIGFLTRILGNIGPWTGKILAVAREIVGMEQ
jgi:hypothetical protein